MKDESNVFAKISPCESKGVICLEREARLLGQIAAASEAISTTLRLIDYFTIPKANGHCVVLLLSHPGVNTLSRYFPQSTVNDLLFADESRKVPLSAHGDICIADTEESEVEELGILEGHIMDLTTFLEFAVQATHCLEMIHRLGITHGEVRANAFHGSAHSDSIRLVHFGTRTESLDHLGSPSPFVIKACTDEASASRVRDTLYYLAPEQTGSYNNIIVECDHRTDLYGLGVLFWTLVVGRGMMPFEGNPLDILHSIVQNRPLSVNDVRNDIPRVLGLIIDKLLAKCPDDRYQSAYGLKQDLCGCQNRLQNAVTADSQFVDLIPAFEIATQEKYFNFVIPSILVGRDDDLDVIDNVLRNSSRSNSISHECGSHDAELAAGTLYDSTRSISPCRSWDTADRRSHIPSVDSSFRNSSISKGLTPCQPGNDHWNANGLRKGIPSFCSPAIIVVGPPGAGKSSLILANQAKWRSQGIWGLAKFQEHESAPFGVLLACLSSVLRQLMVSRTDLNRFVAALKDSLGIQVQNIPLLYQGVPELEDILILLGIPIECPHEPLSTSELRDRFFSLVQKVFAVLADIRPFALFLDDLHDAPTSSLDLIGKLINLKTRLFIFATVRLGLDDNVRTLFGTNNGLRATWINLKQLTLSAVSILVSRALRCPSESCYPLSRYVFESSSGNVFSARRILNDLQRQHHIKFDWDRNHWVYDIHAIEASNIRVASSAEDLSSLITLFRDLPQAARDCLKFCALLGSPCSITEMIVLMQWAAYGSSDEDENEDLRQIPRAISNSIQASVNTRQSTYGLQKAIAEGWLVDRARETCFFTHDRYRHAVENEIANMPKESTARLSLKIILMLLGEQEPDAYRIAKHSKSCLALLRGHQEQENIIQILIAAGASAWTRGAHELALQAFTSARSLFAQNCWFSEPGRTFDVLSKLAALLTWNGNCEESDLIIQECLEKVVLPEDKAKVLRMRSTNHWMRNNFKAALKDTLLALSLLGVDINDAPSRREADAMFEEVSSDIISIGRDAILAIPRASDPKTDLAAALLNDAAVNAYWSPGEGFSDVIGLTTIQVALKSGMSPGTAIGFFWAIGAAAERKEMYRFSVDLARLALDIAELHGGNMEKCRALVLYSAMVSGFDSVHIRANLPRLQEALKQGESAGDRVYTNFATQAALETRMHIGDHLSELLFAAEDCLREAQLWTPGSDSVVLATSILNLIRALGGHTFSQSVNTAFDTEDFKEIEYVAHIKAHAGNVQACLNRHDAFKVVGYYCMGYIDAAAELGFSIYESRGTHPNHRYVRCALFFHSLAMIACARQSNITTDTHRKYMNQIELNQIYLRKWLSPSPVNSSAWVTLVDAEMASLQNLPDAVRNYDVAIKIAASHGWLLEEGWALYLQGCHFVRQSVEGLGTDLQRKGASRQSKWGAKAIVDLMMREIVDDPVYPLKRHSLTSEASVQTIATKKAHDSQSMQPKEQLVQDQDFSDLSAADLANILKWSSDISSDISLSTALRRLTEIVANSSTSQKTCVVIAREAGKYTVATSLTPPDPCQVHEDPKPIQSISDPLQRAVIQIVLTTKHTFRCNDTMSDPRVAMEASCSHYRSVLCLPIFSNRGQTFGAVYLASYFPFAQSTVTMQSLLCKQASVSITNTLLVHAIQAATKDNMKVIQSQRAALEDARSSREEALQATKTKTNFLAAMSHELRTPFSSFYGHMELLSDTPLDTSQKDIVQSARGSCELLLNVIDSILDYSKLEAAAVKLAPSEFSIECLIADCVELLLPDAAVKLDLAFNIEANVPAHMTADAGRIRQVVMNMVGNAVKFTAEGSVSVVCSMHQEPNRGPNDAVLRFTIKDTGIGLSSSDRKLLFVPFQQADNSSTRRFGGTGLGLAICKQLVDLMGGDTGVESELGVGSTFWFTVPVTITNSPDSQKILKEIEQFRSSLMIPYPLRLLLCSLSDTTVSYLISILSGLDCTVATSIREAESFLRQADSLRRPFDFFILDDQSEDHADYLARVLQLFVTNFTQIIHYHTFTKGSPGGYNPGVVRIAKPPRTYVLLKKLVEMSRRLPAEMTASTGVNVVVVPRILFGNVLVAEDNHVSRKLLIAQLERCDLTVTATRDGNEAIEGLYILLLPRNPYHKNIWRLQHGKHMILDISALHYLIIICRHVTELKRPNACGYWKASTTYRSHCQLLR